MSTNEESIRLYAQLAEEHQKQGRPQERDRFLVLAADAALAAGKREVAENFRRTLLARNPNHLLKPYGSLAEALASPDIATYVQELRKTYPPERLERTSKGPLPGGTSLGRDKDAEPDLLLPLEAERRTKTAAPIAFLPEPTPQPPLLSAAGRTRNGMDAKRVSLRQEPEPIPLAGKAVTAFALRPDPVASRPAAIPARARHVEDAPSGGWLGAFLFFVSLVGALALLGHVFVRPFLPK